MGIRKFFKYYILNESVKEIELNRILDKISKKNTLSNRESSFLDLYQTINDSDLVDFMYMSKNKTCDKIKSLIKCGKKVICDLTDRNGKIGLVITDVDIDYENDVYLIKMRGGDLYKLGDNFLYNIIYNNKKDQYSLQEQDEYYEKIYINNNES